MNFKDYFRVKAGKALDLSKISTKPSGPVTDKDKAKRLTEKNHARILELQEVMYAEHKHSLLLAFQAMDAGGKDGAIKVLAGAMNPQGVNVTSFKAPSQLERDHDYLWRVHAKTPEKGMVAVFNRSHYEDVLVVAAHNLVPENVWKKRYGQINAFEDILASAGTEIQKFYLHISKETQSERFAERIAVPSKQWKIDPADFSERKLWDQYRGLYGKALSKCSTEQAPWYVIPADEKWFRDFVISQIVVDHLESLNMKYPPLKADMEALRAEYFPDMPAPAEAGKPKKKSVPFMTPKAK